MKTKKEIFWHRDKLCDSRGTFDTRGNECRVSVSGKRRQCKAIVEAQQLCGELCGRLIEINVVDVVAQNRRQVHQRRVKSVGVLLIAQSVHDLSHGRACGRCRVVVVVAVRLDEIVRHQVVVAVTLDRLCVA